ncbi:hypothetical protein J4468_00600 [Candidatus Woesearchaeota archaeon]|nr:hypothetical protein [Candidatus Woesearchaeota archaeon]
MIEKVTEAMYVAVTKSYTMFHANWINDNLDLAWKGLCLYSSFGNLAYSFKNDCRLTRHEILKNSIEDAEQLRKMHFEKNKFPALGEQKATNDIIITIEMIRKTCKSNQAKEDIFRFLEKNYDELYCDLTSEINYLPNINYFLKKIVRTFKGHPIDIYSSYKTDTRLKIDPISKDTNNFLKNQDEFKILEKLIELKTQNVCSSNMEIMPPLNEADSKRLKELLKNSKDALDIFKKN